MPHPTSPPTPAPSTDIIAKRINVSPPANLSLPPSAMSNAIFTVSQSDGAQPMLTSLSASGSTETHAQYANSRANDSITSAKTSVSRPLIEPPQRSRRIIQVKPSERKDFVSNKPQKHDADTKPKHSSATASKGRPRTTDTTKKRPAQGSSAGRKTARKTAHSLIERRRRSKMNEEFGVLKDMIPACEGQEMHKLAILQASIEYVRYLKTYLAEGASNRSADKSEPRFSGHKSRQSAERIDAPSNEATPSEEASDDSMILDGPSHKKRRSDIGSAYLAPLRSQTSSHESPHTTHSTFSPHSFRSASNHCTSQLTIRSPAHASLTVNTKRSVVPQPLASAPLVPSNDESRDLHPETPRSCAANDVDHEASTALLMLNALGRTEMSWSSHSEGSTGASGQKVA